MDKLVKQIYKWHEKTFDLDGSEQRQKVDNELKEYEEAEWYKDELEEAADTLIAHIGYSRFIKTERFVWEWIEEMTKLYGCDFKQAVKEKFNIIKNQKWIRINSEYKRDKSS